jgi:hypothetical protein
MTQPDTASSNPAMARISLTTVLTVVRDVRHTDSAEPAAG